MEQIDLYLSSSMLLHHHGVSFNCDKKQLLLHQLIVQDCSELLHSRVKDEALEGFRVHEVDIGSESRVEFVDC